MNGNNNASGARLNAGLIVKHSTVYPFRLPVDCMVCVFCCESFEEAAIFRKHMDSEHNTFTLRNAFAHCSEGYIKADCSDVKCRICLQPCQTIEEIAIHLKKHHFKPVNLETPLGIEPFNFKSEKLRCAICEIKAYNLRQLSRHTQTHFHCFTCESCAKSYSTNTALQVHIKIAHVIKGHLCIKCKTQFDSLESRRDHVQNSPRCWKYICNMCGDRFISVTTKHQHMNDVHGIAKKPHVCPECGQMFKSNKAFADHFKVTHTDDNVICPFCGLKFATKLGYEKHKVTHTNEKPYPCTICGKAYTTKHNLTQHMWVHKEEKRFECNLCNKKFNQRVSLKSHIKSNHPDLLNNVSLER